LVKIPLHSIIETVLTFKPPLIFTAGNSFLFAVILSLFCKTTAGKNKSLGTIDILQVFHLCKFLLEFDDLIFRKFLNFPAFYLANNGIIIGRLRTGKYVYTDPSCVLRRTVVLPNPYIITKIEIPG